MLWILELVCWYDTQVLPTRARPPVALIFPLSPHLYLSLIWNSKLLWVKQ